MGGPFLKLSSHQLVRLRWISTSWDGRSSTLTLEAISFERRQFYIALTDQVDSDGFEVPKPRPGSILGDELVAMAQLCLDGAKVIGRTPVAVLGGRRVGIARYGEGLVCDCVVVSLRGVSMGRTHSRKSIQ